MSPSNHDHPYYLADVFTDRPFTGNPLAVFPHGERIAEDDMPRIAAELNLSETSFVLPPQSSDGALRLRIFTPAMELPFAGHPTVGTACILAQEGRLALRDGRGEFLFEEAVGQVRVLVERDVRGYAARFAVARMPEHGPAAPPVASIAEMLSVASGDIVGGEAAPKAVSCGVPYLFVEVKGLEVLARVQLDLSAWRRTLQHYWAPHIYVIARLSDSAVRARMFAPAMGIVEDPATGAAASALAGYLDREDRVDGVFAWMIEQGVEMGRPSVIRVAVEKKGGRIRSIEVGGRSVLIGRGSLLAAETASS